MSSTGLTINLINDASMANAPAAYKAALATAVQYFQNLISSPITVNIQVGYGEIGGSALGAGVLGEAGPDNGVNVTYAQFRAALGAHATSASQRTALAALTATDPTHGGTIYVSAAEAKALGLMPANATGIDASMGFAADPNGSLFAYDPNHRGVAGHYDFIGVAEHEISHALGRIVIADTTAAWYSALDLFRYTAPGVHALSDTTLNYFSIDGGRTNLDYFSTTSDTGDWASSAGNDANNAYSNPGVTNLFTPTDITEMNVLGFGIAGTGGSPVTVSAAAAVAAYNANHAVGAQLVLDTAAGIVASLDGLQAAAAGGGLGSITLSDANPLALGYAQYSRDGAALGLVQGSYSLSITGAPVAALSALAGNPHLGHLAVTDSGAQIRAALGPLEGLALSGRLTAITDSDAGETLIVSAAQAAADPHALALVTGGYVALRPEPTSEAEGTLFDPNFYLASNPDVAAAGVDPLQHFATYGWHEGRNPSAVFQISYYLAQNPDVAAAGVDPLQHYENYGWVEGRNPDPFFNTAYYLSHNPDVAAAGADPLQHFETYGWHEGRDPGPAFSLASYLAHNPDVAAAGINPLNHYLTYGIAEHRVF